MRSIDPLFPSEPNRARYLPAISHEYAVAATRNKLQIAGLSGKSLDYLSKGNARGDEDTVSRHFYYPCTLTSAGQAARTVAKSQHTTMVSQRDRAGTFVIADSGGYQIQQGKLPWEGDATVRRMLRWMEDTADWVMALDFPTGGITKGTIIPHIRRLQGEGHGNALDSLIQSNQLGMPFNACLLQTRINTDLMLAERDPAKAGFLVVLQGRNESESSAWYQEFRSRITDGVAFAGGHARSYALFLSRILDMRADGTLKELKHIHVLGTSTIECAVLFTHIQRLIRQFDNPDLQITYDTASPFLLAFKAYKLYTSYGLDYVSSGFADDAPSEVDPSVYGVPINEWCWRLTEQRNIECDAMGRDMQSPVQTYVGTKLTVGDLL
ncbi:hypothetical protein [Methylobacterium sp. WL8]|uniref:hypothetical protein n=1 Tax=Methylobacterium sp. WL8 TaxID=2603899 RepID=UPI0011CB3C42|nr:hypothetical protein [Methylobacterium sp. WL8]TXN78992.1 hypothetical protein FV234_21895 [Methylobacterium sp. WL8]